ncbi:hypothetical protein acsn021_29660 [Anaerocolumna cellulosilytica]|uniref:Uncharacterized protein n=1 Tax=Anaerocolumna cellulosilytica TaxID=433286 RepID=A0A6S6R5L3_9FIRM|nr:hypothetical protein [Anaerocolumna cellulosilytica]MBB5197184.1 multidrug efflux pump subunit AcrA (membrane-fusion protein) [Anaerocolumna cellulosilytica]BCJ95397.1 hypothetical protein acsn021_29660 [Anaerocolumna cellulosilytica]
MEKKIRKLLLGFFVTMLLLTIISRAADSVMVAKVTVDTVKKGNLSFEISGTGTVKENANKYIALNNGYKIAKVQAEEGQDVEKGEWLFSYDMDYLKALKIQKEKEIKKLQLQYEKLQLATKNGSKALEEEKALQEVANAEDDVKAAEEALLAKKQSVKQKKEEEYTTLLEEEEAAKSGRKEALITAERAVTDAERELASQEEPKLIMEEYLKAYKTAVLKKEEESEIKYREELLDIYYKDKYEEHKTNVYETEKKLVRAKEDLEDSKKKWDEKINYWDQFSTEEETLKAYKEQVQQRESEFKTANREISDLEKSLNAYKEKDEAINKAFADYRLDVATYSQNVKSSYEVLYQLIYDKLTYDKKQLETASIKLVRAKEDIENTVVEWNKKSEKIKRKKNRLAVELQEIEAGKYNFETDLKEETKAIETAYRTLEAARFQLDQLKEGIETSKENEYTEEQSRTIEGSSVNLDIVEKQEELKKLKNLIDKKGKVTSPVKGTISKIEVNQGVILTGGEKVVIATGEYELLMNAGKEDIKYFKSGDKLTVKGADKDNDLTVAIETIGLPGEDGMVKFSALLPEGKFKAGMSLSYQMKKDSKDYRYCIPLEAVRQDSKGTYVLLVKEKNSILGKEQVAFRLSISVIQKDFKTAAIEAPLQEQDLLIVGSSKYISEGDRVRVYEME